MGGGSPSQPKLPYGLLSSIQGAQIDILNIDPNQVIAKLSSQNVPQADATSISNGFALKSVNEVAAVLSLIPGLQQVGGVWAVLSGLFDLLNNDNGFSFDTLIKGIIGQDFIMDHYSYIKGNISTIWFNIKIQKADIACQVIESTYNQVNERMQNGLLKSWYTSMSNKVSLQLLALYYKANVQVVQAFDQALKKLAQEQASKYRPVMTNYLALLDQLKADIVEYRGSLMTITIQNVQKVIPPSPRQPGPNIYWIKQSIIQDRGQDQSQTYDENGGDLTSYFNDFKTKSIAKTQVDLNSIAIL